MREIATAGPWQHFAWGHAVEGSFTPELSLLARYVTASPTPEILDLFFQIWEVVAALTAGGLRAPLVLAARTPERRKGLFRAVRVQSLGMRV